MGVQPVLCKHASMSRKPAQPEAPLQTYGIPFAQGRNQLYYDMVAFAKRIPPDMGVPPRPELFRRIADQLLPGYFEWHSWTEKFIEAACEYSLIGYTGASNSCKTYNAAGFAAVWWLCAPWWSSVMFVSTSVKMLRRRGWANIARAYSMMGKGQFGRYGNFVDSKLTWQMPITATVKADDRLAIFGKAVEEGSVTKSADDIKGVHTIRQMIILDEATAIPPAIWDAVSNLYTYPVEFVLMAMGNIRNRLDAFGRFIEPGEGWTSVTVDTDEWEAKPQIEYGGRVPFIVHFDAEKSPNITENRLVSRHLPQREKVEAARKAAGSSPLYWSNIRGFPPPEGLTKTVFTEVSLVQHDAFGEFKFADGPMTIIGMLDPAFGGNDRAILTFARMGMTTEGKVSIQAFPPRQLWLDVTSKNTIHYQLADEVIRLCERFDYRGQSYTCPLQNLGVDATGEGGGLCSIIERKTGKRIVWVEFGGAASDDTVNLEDGRPAREVFANKRAEIHFRCRDAVYSGQFKGVSRDAALELCTMPFDDERKRIVMQAKKDYKKEFHRSPDFGDSLVGLSEVARLRGFRLAAIEQTVNRFQEYDEQAKASQAVYEDTYAPEELTYDTENF